MAAVAVLSPPFANLRDPNPIKDVSRGVHPRRRLPILGVKALLHRIAAALPRTAKSSEKNSEQVIEKMAAAARALGWPDEIVGVIRAQTQSITKLQIQTMDQIMDAWEEQIKAPNPMTASPATMLSKLKSFPTFGSAGSWPSVDLSQTGARNPLQIWMQLAEQWQKASLDAMSFWSKGGRAPDAGASRHR